MKKKLFVILPMILVLACVLFVGCNPMMTSRKLTVMGGSMIASGINPGDKILVREVKLSEINVGDIIVYYKCLEDSVDYDGSEEYALDFKTGQVEYETNVMLHKVYDIKYDSEGNTWFFTYGTSNLKGEETDDSTPQAVEENYYVNLPVRGDYVIAKYIGKALF